MRRDPNDIDLPIFEEDADALSRICAIALHSTRLRDWRGALDVTADAVTRIEAPGHIVPISQGESGQIRYAHFVGPFAMEAYRRFFRVGDEDLRLVLDDYPLIYRIRALCLDRLGRTDEALASYEKAVAWGPMDTVARIDAADLLIVAGKEREAGAQLRAALAHSLSSLEAAAAYAELSLIAQRQGAIPVASSLVTLALALDPAQPLALDEAMHIEYTVPKGVHLVTQVPQAAAVARRLALLLAPDQRFFTLAITLADECEAKGQLGRAAYFVDCALALVRDEKLAARYYDLATKAQAAGQRIDGADGFAESGTFIEKADGPRERFGVDGADDQPVPSRAAAKPRPDRSGKDAAGARAAREVERARGEEDDAIPPNLAGHDHRSDPGSVRGDGSAPNALGGIPGVVLPGQARPYDGPLTGKRPPRHKGGKGQRP